MSSAPTAKSNKSSAQFKGIIRALGMLPVLILLALAFHALTGKFLAAGNLSIVLQQASINIVLAAGMTFVILTGGIDLSVGSILAASAMARRDYVTRSGAGMDRGFRLVLLWASCLGL